MSLPGFSIKDMLGPKIKCSLYPLFSERVCRNLVLFLPSMCDIIHQWKHLGLEFYVKNFLKNSISVVNIGLFRFSILFCVSFG